MTAHEIKNRVSAAEQQKQTGKISGRLAPMVSQAMPQISFFMNPPYPQTSACEINIEVFFKQKFLPIESESDALVIQR